MSKEKRKLSKDQQRIFKWLKVIILICIAIIVLEVIYIIFGIYNRNNNVQGIDTLNSFKEVSSGYIVAGNSNFKDSKFNSYQDETKAKFAKLTSDFKVEFESAYTKGYQSYFNDVIEYSDGFIAVGGGAFSEEQVNDNATDGLIVLYDKNGKEKDVKRVQVAGDTTLNKVLLLDDGFIVIGQSILQNMVIGNDPNGGALMIKYNFDLEEEWRTNYGGSKSAIFNDAIISDDYIYVVGKDATRYGLIAKYTLAGERLWAKSYEYTDTVGFSSIVKVGDYFFVASSKTTNIDASDADKITEALILKYSEDGKLVDEVVLSKNNNARFNKIISSGNNLIAIGHTYKIDEVKSTSTYNYLVYSGLIAKYDENLKELKTKVEKGSGNNYFSDILVSDDGYLLGGATSSKELGGNDRDYRTFFLKYNQNLQKEWYK